MSIRLLLLALLIFWAPSGYAERGDEGGSASRTKRAQAQPKSGQTAPQTAIEIRGQLTAPRELPRYVPPPRTINDIVAKFGGDREIPANCSAVRSRREVLQGRLHQAAEHGHDPGILVASFERAAQQDFVRGNLSSSVARIKTLQEEVPRYDRAWVVGHALRAKFEALGGDFQAADAAMRKGGRGQCKDEWGGWIGCTTGDKGVWVNIHQAIAEAAIAQSKGLYEGAEVKLRQAAEWEIKEAWKFRAAYDISVHLSLLADNLLRQGRFVEAELEARKALQLFVDDDAQLASLFLVMSEVLYEQGRYAEAEYLGRRAVNLSEANCLLPESVILALANRLVARTLVGQSRWEEAIERYEAIRHALAAKDANLFERKFAGDVEWGLALLKKGRAKEAARPIRVAYERSRTRLGATHPQTAKALGFLAVAHAAQGERQQALEAFRVAIPILLDAWKERSGERSFVTARSQQLRLILEAYIQLLDDIRGTPLQSEAGVDAIEEMFRIADVARSSSVQQALAANSARAAAGSLALAGLVRRQQDAQNQISALQNVLLNVLSQPAQDQNPAVISDLRARIRALRAAQKTLLSEVEKRFPKYAELINPEPPTVADVQRSLRTGEALLSILITDERTFVWAISPSRVAFHSAELSKAQVRRSVQSLRQALDTQAETIGDIPDFDLALAHELYESLLAPLASTWQGSKILLVVADGDLGQLPVSVLPTRPTPSLSDASPLFSGYRDVAWLARDHAIVALPSITSLLSLRGLAPGSAARGGFAGFGDPWFNETHATEAQAVTTYEGVSGTLEGRGLRLARRFAPRTRRVDSAELAQLPRLPETADEVRSMAKALGANTANDVFLGIRASEAMVKNTKLSDRRVLAFATHGLVPGDLNGLSQPALALSSPKLTKEQDDGLLTMGEVLELELNADWVVLSACNTAAAQGAGAEAVSGLGRAFFYAGARSLLVTHWPVETTSAKILTTDVFRRQAHSPTMPRAEALRQSMVGLIDGPGYVDAASGRSLFSYAHPLFWAPFALVGDGG